MIKKDKSFEVNMKAEMPEIKIYGFVGRWDSVNLRDIKNAIDRIAKNGKEVKLLINSGGGSVFEGFAIYDMLVKADLVVHAVVEGMAASMASVILLAADHIQIYENARIMTHKPRGGFWGEADGMRATADLIDGLETSIKNIYIKRTGKTATVVDTWMKAGVDTWHNAKVSVENGLADSIIKTVKKKGTKNQVEDALRLVAEAEGEEAMVCAYEDAIKCINTSEEGLDKPENNFINTMKHLFKDFPSISALLGKKDEAVDGATPKATVDKDGNTIVTDADVDASTEKLIAAFKKDGFELVASSDLKTLNETVGKLVIAKKEVDAVVVVKDAEIVTKQAEVDAKQVEIDAKLAEVEILKTDKTALVARVEKITGKPIGDQAPVVDVADAADDDKFTTAGMGEDDAINAILVRAGKIDTSLVPKKEEAK